VADGLRANMCDDGSVYMWHDTTTGDTWFGTQKPPKRWLDYFKRQGLSGALGAAVPGVCPPHPAITPHPMAKIVRLQKALNGLASRTTDHALRVTADGLVGSRTVKAVNRAMYMYAKGGAPSEFATGTLTHAQVASFSPQLSAYIERSPIRTADRSTSTPAAVQAATAAASTIPPILPAAQVPVQYESSMPPQYAYPSYPGYYPQQPVYYSNRAPGGLPPDQASVDVKAFIPAQYEHVRVDPMTVAAVIAVGLGIYFVMTKKKER
jgi:hypothetical protein